MDGYIESLEDDIALKIQDAHNKAEQKGDSRVSGKVIHDERTTMKNLTVFNGRMIKKETSNGKNDIFFIKGTLVYPNGDMFDGFFHKNNEPSYGTYTYNNGSTYTGNIKLVTEHGPLYDGVGALTTLRNTQYKGQWSDGLRHGNNIKYVSSRPVEGGEYRSGIIVNGVKFFKNCVFQGTFESKPGIPRHGQAVYFTRDRFEGFFHEVPLYKKNKQIDYSSSSTPIPQTKIIVPLCQNGKLFVQSKEVSLKCEYGVDGLQPNFTKFKSMYSDDDVVDLNPVEQEQGIEIDIVLHPLGPGEIPMMLQPVIDAGVGVAMPPHYIRSDSEGGKLKFKSKFKFKTNNRKNKYEKSKRNKTKTKYTRRQKRRLQSKRKN
jgi:hypothetical protein